MKNILHKFFHLYLFFCSFESKLLLTYLFKYIKNILATNETCRFIIFHFSELSFDYLIFLFLFFLKKDLFYFYLRFIAKRK